VPSTWAKADIEEYQRVLGGSDESVVPYVGTAHSTGYQKPATRIQFVYSMHRELVANLWGTRFFAGMSYDSYNKKWNPELKTANNAYQIVFDDVTPSNVTSRGASSINSMYSNGVINGKSTTTFDPYGQITRQEAATILYRLCNALGYKLPKGNLSFNDSGKVASWAQDAVAAVSAAGIMNGVGNNNFDPTGVYTCEQSALCILRTYKLMLS
ncbi:MAG: S-layer homology domain-containing protein, partial [Clostridia bacterium]|nr:S-layer homology domain-containing protein [Clostridia bacterium]